MSETLFWHRCATLLLGLPADKAINRILATLGRAHRADRAWVIRYNSDFTHFWNTHEWSKGHSTKHVTDLQGVPVEMAAWLHETLLKDEPVFIPDIRKMPRRAKALQTEFHRQGIKSLLCVPVFYRGRMMFQIGYDTTKKEEKWTPKEIAILRRAGRLFTLRLLANSPPTSFQEEVGVLLQQSVHLQDSGMHHRVPVGEITHLTAQGDYSRVSFLGGRELSDSRSLRYWESALSPRRFARINRSVIVNLESVESLDRRRGDWKVTLRGASNQLAVGRIYRTDLKHKLES